MDENVLTTAVKIAKIIDDGVDRDVALSKIAQVQAAANYTDDAWETISQIRYVDIRADAIRRSLDNQLTRYISKKETMPELDYWIEKLMEETLAIPNINERCPHLQSIILFILPRLDDKEMALSLVKQARNEFAQLDNLIDRSKYLFTACEMFLQFHNVDEATATLELIQERISDIKSPVHQGLALGMVANEYWKMQDYMSAFECIGRIENREIQSYAYLQLVELLSNSGQFNDAESIVEQQEEKKQKNLGRLLISMGKNVFRSFPKEMNNFVFNLHKSFVFNDELEQLEDNFESDNSSDSSRKSCSWGKPTWVNHLMVIKMELSIDKDKDKPEIENLEDKIQTEIKIVRENQIESFVQFASSEKDSDDDDDGESWKDSDDDDDGESWKGSNADDEGESWKGSDDDDDDESWKGSDDDDGESWKHAGDDDSDDDSDEVEDEDEDDDSADVDVNDDDEEEENDDEGPRNKHDLISDFINNKLDHLPLPEKIRKLHELFLEKVVNINQNLDVPKEKYFCLSETSLGIISFNQALPPKLLQRLMRKIFILFHSIKTNKKDKESLYPYKKEKVEEFTNRMDEIGFDDALQEVISQGDYKFAVACVLHSFCHKRQSELFFGCEYLYPIR